MKTPSNVFEAFQMAEMDLMKPYAAAMEKLGEEFRRMMDVQPCWLQEMQAEVNKAIAELGKPMGLIAAILSEATTHFEKEREELGKCIESIAVCFSEATARMLEAPQPPALLRNPDVWLKRLVR